jgi:hypothetical protein
MERKRSREREIVTLVGRTSAIVEEYYVCPRCADEGTGRRVIHHSEPLRRIIPPNTKYGYDIEIEAGCLQYADNKQMDEIKSIFEGSYGLSVPQPQIHELGIRFLEHMVSRHYHAAPLLRKLFEPGCVYHIDATCESGRGMELTVKEGWTGIVLGAWKIPTENEETIGRHLRSIVGQFGEPVAFVSDMGNGMMAAIASVIREMNLKSRQLVCHMHFLKAVGKSIFEDGSQALKSQFREHKTLASLNRFVKETGDIIKPHAAAMREFLGRWEESGAQLQLSGYLESVAVLRALAQWVIMFGVECKGEGFPFALPHVKLYGRCAAALSVLLTLSAKNCFHEGAARHAKRLQGILQSAAWCTEMQETARGLEEAGALYAELRGVLRLEKTDVYKQEKDKKSPDKLEAVAKLEEETSCYRSVLAERLLEAGTTDAQARAARTILAYFDQYESYLFNHFFVSYGDSGDAIVKLIERSNNIMEHSYRDQKHQIRRRTGAKNLGFVFEHLSPAAALMANISNPAYQQAVLCNKSRSGLADLFSSLDGVMDFRDTPMFQDDLEVVGGRMPKADKKIVGKPCFTEVILTLSSDFRNPQHQLGA